MNASRRKDLERLSDLLADEASAALDARDLPELDQLLDQHRDVPRDEMLKAAALVQVAFLRQAGRPGAGSSAAPLRMPPNLRARLASQGARTARGEAATPARRPVLVAAPAPAARPSPPQPTASPKRGLNAAGYLGWALAAGLAIALVLPRPDGPAAPEPAAARAALLAAAGDSIVVPWAAPSAPGYEQVKGDVVWSPSRQQGYLRLANMPVNDPARTQYQLWIVDPDRDRHPVDGGVFNVGASGEVIIPIQAKLPVTAPTAFAITAERPGGVVVSAGPLLVVAAT